MKNINLQVSTEEAQLIFKALGKLPFEQVYELIGKLNHQVNNPLSSVIKEHNDDEDCDCKKKKKKAIKQ